MVCESGLQLFYFNPRIALIELKEKDVNRRT